MRMPVLCLAAGAVLALEPAPASPVRLDLSGEVSAVSDYRFRGISLSGGEPALQGGLNVVHESGFYAGIWSSTIAETEGGADIELDLLVGYAAELGSDVAVDLSVGQYLYPGDRGIGFAEAAATMTYALGPATPRVGLSYAPEQRAMRDSFGVEHDNFYVFAGLEYAVQRTPLTLDAQVGYERGWFDSCETGGKFDWRIGGTVVARGFSLGLFYVDSDIRAIDGEGNDVAGGGVVASLGFSF